jgi:thiol-disulfide isomerase/thioredoxin
VSRALGASGPMTRTAVKGLVSTAALWLLVVAGWNLFPSWNAANAPDVVFSSLEGERIPLRQLLGRPVLVTFWSTECRPCLEEIAEFSRLHAQYSGRGLKVIAVAAEYDLPSRVVALSAARQIPYTVSLDLDGGHAKAFSGVPAVPYSFLISPRGEIVLEKLGAVDFPNLRKRIETMFSEV